MIQNTCQVKPTATAVMDAGARFCLAGNSGAVYESGAALSIKGARCSCAFSLHERRAGRKARSVAFLQRGLFAADCFGLRASFAHVLARASFRNSGARAFDFVWFWFAAAGENASSPAAVPVVK